MPTVKPRAHAAKPGQLTPWRGPANRPLDSQYSAAMAPQMGPKDAPTIPKKPTRLSASPVTASRAATVTLTSVEMLRGTRGSMVPKHVEITKQQKQVGAREAAAKSRNITCARLPDDP